MTEYRLYLLWVAAVVTLGALSTAHQLMLMGG